jgi:predicted acetyltransferase
MTCALIPATAAGEPALQNLFQLYVHDFSEFWAGTGRGELDDDGRFPAYPFEPYFERPAWRALLIRRGGALAGFALVNDIPHSGLPADHSVAEFFIVRKHRGQGLGRAAARRLFMEAPGLWEVAVARKNLAALAFWRGVIGACAAESSVSELDVSGPDWDGPVIRFEITV